MNGDGSWWFVGSMVVRLGGLLGLKWWFNCFWYELLVILLGSKGRVAGWREREREREMNKLINGVYCYVKNKK